MTMPSPIASIIWGIITLSLLVFVHEGGHFVAARLLGLHVDEFMLGLPGPKISWVWGKTRYGVTAIPFGGYVRIPALEGTGASGELGVMTDEERAVYDSVPAWKRIIVLAAGIVMNLLMAILVFTLVLTLWGNYADKGKIDPIKDGPAAVAGLQQGDHLISIDRMPVDSFDDISAAIGSKKAGDQISVNYTRGKNATSHTATITLTSRPDDDAVTSSGSADDPLRPYLGVTPHYVLERLPLGAAFMQSLDYIRLTADGILKLFRPSTFTQTINQSASVIGISVIAAQAARTGPAEYASLIAAISISLGLMNLLPIPPLDGGKILIEIIQALTRRPIKQSVIVGISMTGFVVLILFMAFVMYQDVTRLIH